ncbi:D-glycero-beta-D-manno-heptose 1-phosphate adenylyltransferase [Kamptonema cortianum]|nr:D-glycero-beta-D-manno-heptose 1-phosphate adenylyltransferase [Geitlerinema splendidum]MDK3157577.1 D-glycero-beta-D-manno-heptose 1-phosphate adenylyltransferase [Kamptonema cortianum]
MISDLADVIAETAGKKVVFTNGVFDILHAGHVTYLRQARDLGDCLVVAINSDDSVRGLSKGSHRPVNTQQDRAVVLAALKPVDFVVVFDEPTPERVLSELRPDIHTKGGDYAADELPESKLVESYGGQVVILPFVPGRSTTQILQKLSEQ